MGRNKVIDKIIDSGLIEEGMWLVLGVSGGPDSLTMLHALVQLSDAYDLHLIPVHINHQLRPEAEDEAMHVEKICDRLGLDCYTFDADCAELAEELKISTEEAGRIIRYEIFDEMAMQLESEQNVQRRKIAIAVAHNADDQSETVLFRLLRGTGLRGLAGIPAVRNSDAGFLIIRPLINIERYEIEQYIRENKLRPNIDRTNSENDYARNRIRNELIPYLEKNFNPNIRATLRRFAELADIDDTLLSELAVQTMEGNVIVDDDKERVILDITSLRNNPVSINARIAGFILQTLGIERFSTYELIRHICEMIISPNPSAMIDLPQGYRALRSYDTIIFLTAEDEELSVSADDNLKIYPRIMLKKDFHPDEDSVYAAFDFDEFDKQHPGRTGEIVLRTRQEGDYLPMKNGRKKIQDFLVDSKVIRRARDSILMVCIGSEVLWILPSRYFAGEQEQLKGRFSPKYHITEHTERILFIEIADNV